MALTKTPVCDFGKKAEDFKLKSINNKLVSLNDIKGDKATLIMFICNHCPYVKAIIKDLVKDCNELKKDGVNSVAIMSNDTNKLAVINIMRPIKRDFVAAAPTYPVIVSSGDIGADNIS